MFSLLKKYPQIARTVNDCHDFDWSRLPSIRNEVGIHSPESQTVICHILTKVPGPRSFADFVNLCLNGVAYSVGSSDAASGRDIIPDLTEIGFRLRSHVRFHDASLLR